MHDAFVAMLRFIQCQRVEICKQQPTLRKQAIFITPLTPGCFCTFKASFIYYFWPIWEQTENTLLIRYHLMKLLWRMRWQTAV